MLPHPLRRSITRRQPAALQELLMTMRAAFLLLALMLLAGPAQAQRYFLQLAGIEGEVLESGYRDWIAIDSFSWSASLKPPASGATAHRITKPEFSDFAWSQTVDRSSPPVLAQLVGGRTLRSATLDVVRLGGSPLAQLRFFQMVFEGVQLRSYALVGGTDSLPRLSASLNAERVILRYWPQRPDGSLGTPLIASIDLRSGVLRGDPAALRGLREAASEPEKR